MFNLILKRMPSITISELKQVISDDTIVLDVRTSSEYRRGHIPFSKNIPLSKLDSYKGRQEPLYIICQSGVRSRQATKKLRKKGYDAINVRGGMNQWTGSVRKGN